MKTDALIILDGYGLSDTLQDKSNKQTALKGDAIKAASTPFLDSLFSRYPSAKLSASGLDVGLTDGQMGNSEVGHLNIGAGRVVYQDITAIDKSIKDGDFFTNPDLINVMKNAANGKALHLAGLMSDGGVHSHLNHLYALLDMAKQHKIQDVFVHFITDGRDTPPKSGIDFVQQVQKHCQKTGAKIATVLGRFYFMDRDNRWERVEKGYTCVYEGEGLPFNTAQEAIDAAYNRGETDEFILPSVIGGYKGFNKGDSFVFFNFRADRAREITRAAIQPDFDVFARKRGFLNPVYAGMTQYDAGFTGLYTLFPPKKLSDTLGEYLSKKGKTQARIAETEKYAHVTFFFNGGVEKANDGEQRYLVPSPKVETYDLMPQMSAAAVADKALEVIGKTDVLILNFANCDMVGHTGVFDAAVKAVETVDANLKKVVEAVLKNGGTAIVTSDHGNAETMLLSDGSPMTAHSTNPVPIILAGHNYINAKLNDGRLCDIAPTLLEIMGIQKPALMDGVSLLKNTAL